jgi:peptidoglycan/xylan/chitin deacetylase (PgdA/CDA1 family)
MSKADVLARALSRSGLGVLVRSVVKWSGILCVNYHRVGDARNSDFDRALWSADEAAFSAQIAFLKSHVDIIGPSDLEDVLTRRVGRYALITFDDGYVDNYTAAFPILREHGVQATFFITTGFIDGRRIAWWDEIAWMVRTCTKTSLHLSPWFAEPVQVDGRDREDAIRMLLKTYKTMAADATPTFLDAVADATGSGRYPRADGDFWMTWGMIRDMRAAGMSIGGHTINHQILARMGEDQQWSEISGCASRLQEELGCPMRFFSYPIGGVRAFNEETRRCLIRAGVEYAFSYYGGYTRFDRCDKYDMRRIAVEPYIGQDRFRAIVTCPGVFGRVRST